MEYADIIGYIAGILAVISLVPQVIKSWKTKSTRDLSLKRYSIYTLSLFLWVVYGFLIQNGPIIVMTGASFLLACSILYLKLRYG